MPQTWVRDSQRSLQEIRMSGCGHSSGFHLAIATMPAMNTAADSRPGSRPAISSWAIDCSVMMA